MTDLITEARELCEKVTPGEWKVKLHNEDYGQGYGETTYYIDMEDRLLKIGLADSPEKCAKHNTLATFIARSRTLIPELCDALEKAQAEIPRWIPVTERLPEVDESGDVDVLVHMDDGFIATCTYDRNASYIASDCWLLWRDAGNVTHWMPLPAAPEKGE